MRVLIIHPENKYFAGAEKVLGYFLTELVRQDIQAAVAAVKGSRVADALPAKIMPLWIEDCPAFSPNALWRQAAALKKHRATFAFELVHGWAARDWELASLTGWRCGCPAIGTLHDHPEASFISGKRRRLMRWCARVGLKKIVCVSGAVQAACVSAGYPPAKLAVVHNGLPAHEPRSAVVPTAGCGGVSPPAPTPRETPREPAGQDGRATDDAEFMASMRDFKIVETSHEPPAHPVHSPTPGAKEGGVPPGEEATERVRTPFRVGFLGTFSERKGLRDLFQIADTLAMETRDSWELHLAGGAQDENGKRLVAELCSLYETKNWWRRVRWHGWVESPQDFLKYLDLLIVASTEFDPFPTVLLEAGQVGVPVLATNVGGVPEVVVDGQTGWLFEPGNVNQAIQTISRIMGQADLKGQIGCQGAERIKSEFSAAKMVAEYRRIYSNLLADE
ncbi:MAG: glycosyltransferase family 4 protein [Verrucomicrobiota bacterium]|nr:glycosyltransferase family 4 protein [Verrucomicrobiota bacterium]